MKKLLNRDNFTFSGMQWFMWSGYGVYYGFVVPYLKAAGYNEVSIGILISVQALVGSFAPVLWGAVTDKLKSPKVILVLNVFVGCASALLVPLVLHSFALLVVIFVIISLTIASISTVLDGWAMRLKDRGAPLNYGLVRGLGSLSFAATTVVIGTFFERHGMGMLFALFFIIESFTAVCVLTVNNRTGIAPARAVDAIGNSSNFSEKPLYRNAPYILFIFLCTFLFMAETAAHTFYPLLLAHAGGTTADLGLGLGLQALSEVPVMFLSSRLMRKYKDTTLLAVAMGFYVVRFSMFALVGTVHGLIWVQLTQSLSYGLFLPVSIHYISRITPVRLKATAITLATSVYYGIGGILGSAVGGVIIERFGISTMYLCSAALALGAAALYAAAQIFLRKTALCAPHHIPL